MGWAGLGWAGWAGLGWGWAGLGWAAAAGLRLLGCWAAGLGCWAAGLLGCWAAGLLGCWVLAAGLLGAGVGAGQGRAGLNGHSRLPECTVLGELADFIHHRAGPWTFRAWPARRPALIKASVAHMFSRRNCWARSGLLAFGRWRLLTSTSGTRATCRSH